MLEIKDDLRQLQSDDLRGARRSRQLQEEYAGQLVVLHKRKVIAHGHDESDLLDQVTSEGYPRDELVIVEVLPADFELPPEFVSAVRELQTQLRHEHLESQGFYRVDLIGRDDCRLQAHGPPLVARRGIRAATGRASATRLPGRYWCASLRDSALGPPHPRSAVAAGFRPSLAPCGHVVRCGLRFGTRASLGSDS